MKNKSLDLKMKITNIITIIYCLILYFSFLGNFRIAIIELIAPIIFISFLIINFVFLVLKFNKNGIKNVLLNTAHFLGLTAISVMFFAFLNLFLVNVVVTETSPNGGSFQLAQEINFPDKEFSVWQKNEINLLNWTRLPLNINFSAAKDVDGDPRLKFFEDQNILLIGKGEVWTDCFVISGLKRCDSTKDLIHWSETDKLIENSKSIETFLSENLSSAR